MWVNKSYQCGGGFPIVPSKIATFSAQLFSRAKTISNEKLRAEKSFHLLHKIKTPATAEGWGRGKALGGAPTSPPGTR